MIDPERIQRLAAKLGNRNDALEFVRQMKCGGRKYPDGGKFFRTELQSESPLMYQPMMPVYPDVAVPERYYPEPNLGDYEYPESTGMIQAMPIRREMSVSAPPTGVLADEVTVPVSDLFSDEAVARRALKQRYAESSFNDRAVSKAGAQGAWQIMPITLKDYLGRGRGKAGDLNDPEYNRKVRDWVMGIIPRDLQEFWSEDDSDRAKLAKLYAAYNWGAGNLRGFLRKKQKAGVDISNPDNWVDDLNPETRRYVKYLAFDEDIPDTTYTNAAFEKEAAKRGFAYGGKIRIKPENRGKFTALKKRTGHSASWFKAHGTPAQKKMAVFALNAKKWKHGDGGPLDKYGDDAIRKALSELKANKFREGGEERKSFWKLPVRVPNMTGTATAAATGLRDIPLTDSTIGKELAVAGTALSTIAGPVAVNWLSNPANQIIASKLAIPLIASETANAGVREYTPFSSWGEGIYYPIRKFNERYLPDIPDWANEAGEFVSEFTNPGFVMFPHSGIIGENMRKGVDKILEYPRGVGKRVAEVAVRMGDIAEVPSRYPKQFFNKDAIRYIFDPKADPELVYRLPYKYSGESSGNLAFGAHKGDIVDQFFGKTPVPNATYDRSVLPERMREYLLKNYPDKNVPIVDIGNAHAPFRWASDLNPRMDETSMQELVEKMTELGPVRTGVRSGGILKNGRFVLDPGGFDFTATRVPDGYRIDAMDIWKYKPNEYSKAYLGQWSPKRILQRAGLKFIDRQGTPIIHRWNEVVPHLNGM